MGNTYNEIESTANPVLQSPLDNSYGFSSNVIINYDFGSRYNNILLNDLTISFLFKYNSGHPYNRFSMRTSNQRIEEIMWHTPVGEFNSFTSPSIFQMDLRIQKKISITEKLKLGLDFRVINLFDIVNEINVFPTSGSTGTDGRISSGNFDNYIEIYGEDFTRLYEIINHDYYEEYKSATGFNLFGPPRQIFFGITLEY